MNYFDVLVYWLYVADVDKQQILWQLDRHFMSAL